MYPRVGVPTALAVPKLTYKAFYSKHGLSSPIAYLLLTPPIHRSSLLNNSSLSAREYISFHSESCRNTCFMPKMFYLRQPVARVGAVTTHCGV